MQHQIPFLYNGKLIFGSEETESKVDNNCCFYILGRRAISVTLLA